MSWEATVLEFLSASLLRPLVLVAAALLVLRAFRVEHPASKHAVWTAVLIGMMVLPFVSVMAPHLEFQALPAAIYSRLKYTEIDTSQPDPPFVPRRHNFSQDNKVAGSLPSDGDFKDTSHSAEGLWATPATRVSSTEVVLGLYLLGLIAFTGYRVAGLLLMKRLVSRSRPSMSVLRESPDVTVPSVAGLLRPVVIVPAAWREWSASSRRAALAHEFAHIRRKDLWVLALSRWTRCIFWFHPLSWWVAKKVSELAEMACDAAAVERLGDAGRYSKILVDFAGAVSRRGYRATLPGLGMFGRSSLSRRIDAVFAVSNGAARRLAKPVVVAAIIGVPCLSAAAVFGLTEVAARPLQQVRSTVAAKIESVAQAATTSGVVAAIAEVVPPIMAQPEPPQASPQEFVARYCVNCHSQRAASGRLVLADQDLTRLNANPRLWERVIQRLRTGLEPYPEVARPGPAEVRNFVEWLETELDRSATPYFPATGPHRLNRTEYANAIHDVLGLDINPALLLPSDDSIQGFDNLLSDDSASVDRATAYSTAADRLSSLAMTDSVSRQTILICRPTNLEDQEPCVQRIIENLLNRAFRQAPTSAEINAMLDEYRKTGTYWSYDFGIQKVLHSILMDPRFLYRRESEPSNVASGQAYRISDIELASRLSFFLWSRGPDSQLLDVASRGQLSNPVVLEQETRRMLKDPRAIALTVNFAGQWLNLRQLEKVGPMPRYPEFDEALRQAMRRETELFFNSIVQEDRNVVDLLTADYTFVNERLAKHYGIANIFGSEFRRVALAPAFDARRGLLGKAAILTVTSYPERTSLTSRGKWILGTLLGGHPPDPPPNVPPLRNPVQLPMREAMQQHAINPACVTCHKMIDPIGISLENFDPTGQWRTQDWGKTIDSSTELWDGTQVTGPADLRNALVSRSDQFLRNFTLKLLTYSLGRTTSYQDMPLVRSIVRDAAHDGNRFSAIVVGIVKSPAFQMNTKN